MRMLVLCHEGAPMMYSLTAGPVRDRITEWPDDDVDLWSVWEVQPAESMAPSFDATAQFARNWSKDLRARDLIPAFVLVHVPELMPNPIARRA